MTVKSLPAAPEGRPFARENRDLPSSAMERWNGGIKAAKSDDNSISVFDGMATVLPPAESLPRSAQSVVLT